MKIIKKLWLPILYAVAIAYAAVFNFHRKPKPSPPPNAVFEWVASDATENAWTDRISGMVLTGYVSLKVAMIYSNSAILKPSTRSNLYYFYQHEDTWKLAYYDRTNHQNVLTNDLGMTEYEPHK